MLGRNKRKVTIQKFCSIREFKEFLKGFSYIIFTLKKLMHKQTKPKIVEIRKGTVIIEILFSVVIWYIIFGLDWISIDIIDGPYIKVRTF